MACGFAPIAKIWSSSSHASNDAEEAARFGVEPCALFSTKYNESMRATQRTAHERVMQNARANRQRKEAESSGRDDEQT